MSGSKKEAMKEKAPAGEQPVDVNELETREWLDSLDYVIQQGGRERVQGLLERLRTHARQARIEIPFSANTPYINTIQVEQQPVYPGSREIERRIKSLVRWNALAMVVRANRIEVEIFDVGYHIIGGGEEGGKTTVRAKEAADHSLPYILAVALLDDQVMPEQYRQERIQRFDVQTLLYKIRVRISAAFSQRFPGELPCRITVFLNDGRVLVTEKYDYEGFLTRPIVWQTVVRKFILLSKPHADESLLREIIDMVANLEAIRISDLLRLLARVQIPQMRSESSAK